MIFWNRLTIEDFFLIRGLPNGLLRKIKKPQTSAELMFEAFEMCPGTELNRYDRCGSQDFKSCVSTNSTTGARPDIIGAN